MSDTTVKVDLEQNSKYRVAYDLMTKIAFNEQIPESREYYLRLYRQCLDSVSGYKSIDEVVTSNKETAAIAGLRY